VTVSLNLQYANSIYHLLASLEDALRFSLNDAFYLSLDSGTQVTCLYHENNRTKPYMCSKWNLETQKH